jgi:hypothetical protein
MSEEQRRTFLKDREDRQKKKFVGGHAEGEYGKYHRVEFVPGDESQIEQEKPEETFEEPKPQPKRRGPTIS